MAWGDVHVEFDGQELDDPLDAGTSTALRAWIASLLGADQFNVLLGSGFSIAAAIASGAGSALSMASSAWPGGHAAEIDDYADKTAAKMGRGTANVEDQLRAALQLIGGLEVLGDDAASDLASVVSTLLTAMAGRVLTMERNLEAGYGADPAAALPLLQFLLGLTQRPASRERTHLFTTNYDRVIEFGCDLAGIRTLDRFVGTLSPVFRSSRLGIDFHYSPPGIRGEPRYLEGVARLTKLHGSIDWRFRGGVLRRDALAFGADGTYISPTGGDDAFGTLMIDPNPAKDVETLSYPYAELFRDFSAAICRPNTTLLTYGYGFGDDHINRVISDMCAVGSTHLMVVSFDDAGERIPNWLASNVSPGQRTVVAGAAMATMDAFAKDWLPSPTLDAIRVRAVGASAGTGSPPPPSSAAP